MVKELWDMWCAAEEFTEDTMAIAPCCCLQAYGSCPILITAPHSIAVLRDKHPAHKPELHTSVIADHMGHALKGTTLQWSDLQQRSSEILWKLSDSGELLDPRVRDPNFLSEKEVASDPWHRKMRELAGEWRREFPEQPLLHIDVHGCKDPPATSSHLTIGLGAMLQHAESKMHKHQAAEKIRVFGDALKAELPHILAPMLIKTTKGKEGQAGERRLLQVVDGAAEGARFYGAWVPESGRYTQSQQAVLFAGFTYSIQLEISKALRGRLAKDRKATARLCNALRAAWTKAVRSSGCEDEPLLPHYFGNAGVPKRLSRKSISRKSVGKRTSKRLSSKSTSRQCAENVEKES
jgi:hypothetical protein